MTRTDSIAIAAARQSALSADAPAAAPALRAADVAMPSPLIPLSVPDLSDRARWE
jgi:hypothetical protein